MATNRISDPLGPNHRRRDERTKSPVQPLDDGRVGHAGAFAHGLEAVAATSSSR